MEYVPVGQRFNNAVFHGLRTLITKKPPAGRSLFLVATTSAPDFVEDFGLKSAFDNVVTVRKLKTPNCKAAILRKMPGFAEDPVAVTACVEAASADIGVKRLIMAAKQAKFKADVENSELALSFMETMAFQGIGIGE